MVHDNIHDETYVPRDSNTYCLFTPSPPKTISKFWVDNLSSVRLSFISRDRPITVTVITEMDIRLQWF